MIVCLMVVGVVLVGTGLPQQTTDSEPQQTDEEQLRHEIGEIHEAVEVDLVNVYLTATNKEGEFVTDLAQGDFILKEDGVTQEITNFTNFVKEDNPLPVTLVLIVDDSPSMSEGTKDSRKIDIAKRAGLLVMNELRTDDQVFLLTFHEKDFGENGEPPEKEKIRQRLTSLKTPYGVSPLFDTIDSAVEKMKDYDGRKILLICSDGQDISSVNSLNEVLTKIKLSTDTLVISLGTVDYARSNAYYWYGEEEDYKNGKDVMERLAENGGGYAFFPAKYKDLDSIMEKIRQVVKSQYSLGYSSTNRKADGSWRNIEIVCKRSDLKIRYRRGYYSASAS